ncbi:MAG: hypothetical protein WA726_07470 [Acidimicrobiia bacterium]
MRSALTAMPLVAAIIAVAALVVDPGPLGPGAQFLVGLGILGTALVGVVGMVVVGGRWALRMARIAVVMCLVVAIVRPIDIWWWLLLVAVSTASSASFLPAITDGIRKLPSATGPPARAVLTPLLLVVTPFIIGLAAWQAAGPGIVVVGMTAPLVALWYARVFFGGLLAVRLGWPILTVSLAPFQPLIPAIVSVALAICVVALAWDRSVKVAFHPPREHGTVYPIPPEMTPSEIRDAARIDERGRTLG